MKATFGQAAEPILGRQGQKLTDVFYREKSGSLTTPGCFESVTWTVFEESLAISEGQMTFFRDLLTSPDEEGKQRHLVDNFRPVQPRNQRYENSDSLGSFLIFCV